MAERNERERNIRQPRSRAEIFAAGVERASQLAVELVRDHSDKINNNAFFVPKAISILAEIDSAVTGPEAYRKRARELEDLGLENHAAKLYIKGAFEGDVESSERLHELLDAEKESFRDENRDPEKGRYDAPLIWGIIETCAKNGVPADSWIEKYQLDNNHAAVMKLRYSISEKKEAEKQVYDGQEPSLYLGLQYLDEVNQHFLAEDQFDPSFAVGFAPLLWDTNEDGETRNKIFEKVKQSITGESITYPMFNSALALANNMMGDRENITLDQAVWWDQFIEHMKASVLEFGIDPFTVHADTARIQIRLAHYLSVDPQDVIAKIDETTQKQLGMDIPEKSAPGDDWNRNKQAVERKRDFHLRDAAELSAKTGDFAAAKVFLDNIIGSRSKRRGIEEVAALATTQEQVSILTPDELTLMVHPGLEDALSHRQILLRGNVDEIKQLALELAGLPDNDKYLDSISTISDCVEWMKKYDADKGLQLDIETDKLRPTDSIDKKMDIAVMEYRAGDLRGLDNIIDVVEETPDPFHKLYIYARVAEITKPEPQPKSIALGQSNTTINAIVSEPDPFRFDNVPGKAGDIFVENDLEALWALEPEVGDVSGKRIADQENDRPDDTPGPEPRKGKSK